MPSILIPYQLNLATDIHLPIKSADDVNIAHRFYNGLGKLGLVNRLISRAYRHQKKRFLFKIGAYIGLLMCLLPTSMAQAISATTKGKIQASAPYIKFDDEGQAESGFAHMFSLKLSDGRYYAPTDAQIRAGGTVFFNRSNNPIEFPVMQQSVNDIEMLIPSPLQRISLNDLIITNSNWRDDDGDGQGSNGVYITPTTGELKMELRDSRGNTLDRSAPLDLCSDYYIISLSTPEYQLMTEYGMPRENARRAISVSYYIKPKPNRTTVCSARSPGLDVGGSVYGVVFKTDSDPTKNFPRTGFHGAQFSLKMTGETVESIIKATEDTPGSGSVTQGGVTMKLFKSTGKNMIEVRLAGPTSETNGGTFTPSTFLVKSADGKPIYSFALSKWFVSSTVSKYYPNLGVVSEDENYCQMLKGNYRIPSVQEYDSTMSPNNLYGVRAIGNGKRMGIIDANDDGKGGLFNEWHYIDRNYYPTNDWRGWADILSIDNDSDGARFIFSPSYGGGGIRTKKSGSFRSTCVTP